MRRTQIMQTNIPTSGALPDKRGSFPLATSTRGSTGCVTNTSRQRLLIVCLPCRPGARLHGSGSRALWLLNMLVIPRRCFQPSAISILTLTGFREGLPAMTTLVIHAVLPAYILEVWRKSLVNLAQGPWLLSY